MDSAGLEHTAIHIQQFDTHRLVIAGLEFTRPFDGGVSRVEASGIRIDYDPAQLADGQLQQISIERLLLHHENTAGGSSQPLDPAALLQLLNTDWRGFAPFNTFTIDRIEPDGAGFGALEHKPHRLLMHKTGTKTEARLRYLGEPSGKRELVATLTDDTLVIKLGSSDRPEKPVLHASLKPRVDGIDIDWHMLPVELKSWLEAYVHVADFGKGASVSGTLNIELAGAGRINAKLRADTKNYRFQGYRLLQPALSIALKANMETPDQRIDILPGSYVRVADIASETLSVGNCVLNLLADYTHNPNGPWSVNATAGISRLPVSYTGYHFALRDVQNRIHADAEGVSLNTVFSPETLPGKFTVDVSHATASATGTAALTMPQALDLDGEESHLAQLLTAWPFPFDLVTGAIQLNGVASWTGGALHRLDAGAVLTDIGGHYNELVFSGLNYRQQLDLLPAASSARSSRLTLEHIDAGVAIENVSARIDVGPSDYGVLPKLFVNGLKGHLFGGDFTGDPFAYDLNTPANALTVHVHGIDLAEVIATQQFHDIEVSGSIDGDLPVELNPFGVFINNGTLHNATPSGVIRYRPSAGAGGLDQNPLTGIALKALSEFHYDTLKARANYVPDGTLTLNFEIKGTSPPLETSRPVHLNLNTEQNLLSLLESIRYVDGLSQGLDKSVREMYQRQTEH